MSQTTILLDDLGLTHASLGYHLKIWADEYACTAEIKGGVVPLKHHSIVVTSQYPIVAVFGSDPLLC
jgi:hypothetical protein